MPRLFSLLLSSLAIAATGVRAQCLPNSCDMIYPVQYGWVRNGDCGTDPQDGTYPEYGFEVCPCLTATFVQTATFISAGQPVVASLTSTLQPSSTTTVFFTYSDLPNTAIDVGALVTGSNQYINPTATYFPEGYSYTNIPVSSIFYATATSTLTTYSTTTASQSTYLPHAPPPTTDKRRSIHYHLFGDFDDVHCPGNVDQGMHDRHEDLHCLPRPRYHYLDSHSVCRDGQQKRSHHPHHHPCLPAFAGGQGQGQGQGAPADPG